LKEALLGEGGLDALFWFVARRGDGKKPKGLGAD